MKLALSMALLLASLMTGSPVVAAALGAESIVGVWRLFAYTSRDEETGIETKPWGENPEGLLMYTADGYMSGIGGAEGRTAARGTGEKLNEEMAKLFTSMTAYTGRYTVEADRVIHHVESPGIRRGREPTRCDTLPSTATRSAFAPRSS